jgi:hypothetical protein
LDTFQPNGIPSAARATWTSAAGKTNPVWARLKPVGFLM